MKQILIIIFFNIFFCITKSYAQDTLFTKSIIGAGSKNLSITNPVYTNGKVVFFVSNSFDSVATPNMKMVIVDTCGNVEKIHTIPLEGHWGIEFFGGINYLPTTLITTSDNQFLLSGYQHLTAKSGNNQSFLFKIDWNGKIVLNEKLPKKGTRQQTIQLLETKDAYYVGGLRWGLDILELLPYTIRVGKDNKNKWYAETSFPNEMRVVKDTLYLLDGEATTKLDPLLGTEFIVLQNNLQSGYLQLNRFFNDSIIVHYGTQNIYDSLNQNTLHQYLFFLKTDRNFKVIKNNILIPNKIKEYDEYIENVYMNKSNGSTILSTWPVPFNSPNYLFLRKIDINGKILWSRADTIEHYGAFQSYDLNVGCLHLPFGNTMCLLYSQLNYINDKTNIIYEFRVSKFDAKGSETLKKCTLLDLEEKNKKSNIVKIFPNPFSETTTIFIDTDDTESNYTFQLLDTNGRLVQKSYFQGSSLLVKRENLAAGIYFFQVVEKNNVIGNGKMIIE